VKVSHKIDVVVALAMAALGAVLNGQKCDAVMDYIRMSQTAAYGWHLLAVPRTQVLLRPVLMVSWLRTEGRQRASGWSIMCSLKGRSACAADRAVPEIAIFLIRGHDLASVGPSGSRRGGGADALLKMRVRKSERQKILR
jgi:hypothetical protein